ncbi:MAG: efflux RND transporter permease subunit [Elusimicrobia bacterium]|nr:efflux RND transporter permease subunit [Elusimicrobiota bacterium]
MHISGLWIKRPVMTVLVMTVILFFGILSYKKLPINNLPTVDFPVIVVNASLPGATPETMAATVATPLEKQFAAINGLQSMTSKSMQGSTEVVLMFSLDRNIDSAALDVNTAIAAASQFLPTNLPSQPTYSKVNPADTPILYFALTSDTLPMSQVNEYAETTLTQYFSSVEGVAQVQIYGSQKYAVRVQVDPNKLFGKSMDLNDVKQAVSAGNVDLPGGLIDGSNQSYTVETKGQLTNAQAYTDLVVRYQNGYPVKVKDIGTATDSVQYDKSVARYADHKRDAQTIIMAIRKQPGTNAVQVAKKVQDLLPKLRTIIPPSVEIIKIYDQSDYIEESINDVQFTLLLTIALVVGVIFLFLRSAKATIIPSIVVPLSLVATFAVMYVLGFSLNNLSLMALTLSVGFVVDDAVVMLENIVRRMEEGEDALEAAMNGSKEIEFTIISMTLSLVVVFVPIIFMGGIVGRLFREFAVSIGMAILVSGFMSVTLTPMLCSRLLRGFGHKKEGEKENAVYAWSERVLDSVTAFYGRTLSVALRHKSLSLVFTAVALVGSLFFFQIMPKGFIPSEDRDYMIVYTQADDKATFSQMEDHQAELLKIAKSVPELSHAISVAGMDTINTGFLLLSLVTKDQRTVSVDQMIVKLRQRFAEVPGIVSYLNNPPPITVSAHSTNALWQYNLQSSTLEDLYTYVPIMTAKLSGLPGLTDVNSDLQLKKPKLVIHINRDKASALGFTLSQIEEAVYSAYGSRYVSTIYGDTNQYYVILELLPDFRQDASTLAGMYLRAPGGQMVALSTMADIEETVAPLSVNHSRQIPSATISFNLAPGQSIGPAMAAINKVARDTLPPTITPSFDGSAQSFAESFGSLGFLLIITIFIIYVVLGILYESYIHPITILSSLPLAGFGALLALWVFHMELDIYAFVGIIMLVGLVKKNGIMMVDAALEIERARHLPSEQCIYDACLVRFRPIMMTTMAALLGTMPIAIGFGAGGESRAPMGVAVVGGLFVSQMMTLYVTPVFYIYFDRISRRLSGEQTAISAPPPPPPPPPQMG